MAILRSLLVTLGMNSAQYRSDLERSKKKTKTDYKEMAKATASFAAKSSAAFAATAVAMSVANAKMIRDQSNMAKVAQMTLGQYQKLAFAAEQYNVSAEQIADISKDTLEKIGEYINAGSGGLQDFADAMGMTKDETLAWAKSVQGMSGQQVFQKMINEMEAVGLSSEQMSNALESLGSDATKLIPLFSNNGKELDRLSDKYDKFNGQLSQKQIENYRLAAENIDLLAVSARNLSAVALAEMADGFGDLAKGLAEYTQQIQAFGTVQATLNVLSGTTLREKHREIFGELQELKEDMAKYEGVKYDDLPSINPFGLSKNEWFNLQSDYSRKRKELEDLNNQIVEIQKGAASQFEPGKPLELKITPKISKTAFESELDPEKTFADLYGGTDTVDLFALNLAKKNSALAESLAEQLALETESMDDRYSRELEFLEQNLSDYDQFLEAKSNLDKKYAQQKQAAEIASMQAVLSATESFSSAMLGIMNEESEGYKAMFLISQAAAFANAMVAANLAYAQVLAHDAGILGMGAVASAEMVRGLGYASAAAIAGQSIAGVFHAGSDFVPDAATRKDSSILIEGGERIISKSHNQELMGIMRDLKGGASVGGNIQVIVQGSIYGDEQTKKIISAAAAEGYARVGQDFKSNGVLYRQARR